VADLLAVEFRRPFEGDAALVAVRVRARDLRIAPRRLRRDVALDDLRLGPQLRRQIALADGLRRPHFALLLLRGHGGAARADDAGDEQRLFGHDISSRPTNYTEVQAWTPGASWPVRATYST